MSARPDSLFLQRHDVEFLTGYEMPSYQLKWCKRNGIPAWLNAKGEVAVPVAAIEGRKAAANEPGWAPDLKAFRGE